MKKKVNIRLMTAQEYDGAYRLLINTSGMGLNSVDDGKEGIKNIHLIEKIDIVFQK